MTYIKCWKSCILIFYFTTYCYIIPRDVDHMINNVKGELLVMNSLGIKTNYATHSRKYGIECIVFYANFNHFVKVNKLKKRRIQGFKEIVIYRCTY